MVVSSVTKISNTNCVPVYDIPNTPGHNFIIKGNSFDYVLENCAVLDECNFGKVPAKGLQGAQGQITRLYESTKSRQQTRFSYRNGKVRGMMILVSSKRSDLDFLDTYIQKVKNNEGVYIVDEPVWNVRPKQEFSETTFKIGIGDKNHQSMILDDNITPEEIVKLESEGYTIIDVPDNLRKRFEGNLERNIMDLAGISVANITKFISPRNYNACINHTRTNPFTSEILTIGTKDKLSIQQFFLRDKIPSYLWDKPLFIHIDGAKGSTSSSDMMGISGVWQYGIYEKEEKQSTPTSYDVEQDDSQESSFYSNYEVRYMHAFSVCIKGPDGAQIDWSKARSFLYWLRGIGFNIRGISIDGYQSLEMQQILTKKGFNVKQLSLDIKTTGWDNAKQIIGEQRIDILPHELLENEVTRLECNLQHSKVDHPLDGSKDCADSFAGALWNAVLNSDIFVEEYAYELNTAMMYDDGTLADQDRIKMQLMESLAKNGEQTTQDVIRNILHKQDKTGIQPDVERFTKEEKEEYNKQVEERKQFISQPGVYTPEVLSDPDIFLF